MAKQKILLPGDVLKEKIAEYQLSVRELAEVLNVTLSSIRQLTDGKTKISIPMAFRLAKYFGDSAQYWIDLQYSYEIATLKKDEEFQAALREIPKAKKKKGVATPTSAGKSRKADQSAQKEAKTPKVPKTREEAHSSEPKRRGRKAAVKDDPNTMHIDVDFEKLKHRGRPAGVKNVSVPNSDSERPKRRGRPASKTLENKEEINPAEKSKPNTILIKKADIPSPELKSWFEDDIKDDTQS
jgi:addiction module HigA family antidote